MTIKSNFPDYCNYLRKILSPDRLTHVINTERIGVELAGLYGYEDIEQVGITCLIHDIGKERSLDEMEQLIANKKILYVEPDYRNTLYLHGPVGAYYAKELFGIKDSGILNAIEMHTGMIDREMDLLTKILCIADILSRVKEWNGYHKFRLIAYSSMINQAILLWYQWNIDAYEVMDIPVHPALEKWRNFYMKLVGPANETEFFAKN